MVHARTTTCSDGLRAAQTPDGEPHREQHNTGGHHETKVETRERQSAAAVDDDRLRNSVVLCIRMLLRTPELLLNAASRLTVTLLRNYRADSAPKVTHLLAFSEVISPR